MSYGFLPPRRWLSLVLASTLAVGAPLGAEGEAAPAPALKAAFLLQFAKFAEWPADVLPSGAPLALCVVGEPRVAAALEQASAKHDVAGHRVTVRTVDLDGLGGCHMVYAEGLDAHGVSRLLDSAKGQPILTVSDHLRFAEMGGMLHLFVENGRMRFAANVEATGRHRMRLSSLLLTLAVIVKDDSNVPSR